MLSEQQRIFNFKYLVYYNSCYISQQPPAKRHHAIIVTAYVNKADRQQFLDMFRQ